MNDKYIFIYIFGFLSLISTIFCSYSRDIHILAVTMCIYLLFKWLSDYRKCTLSYIEIKLRNIKKEQGILYNFLEDLIDFNTCKNKDILYSIITTILLINISRIVNLLRVIKLLHKIK